MVVFKGVGERGQRKTKALFSCRGFKKKRTGVLLGRGEVGWGSIGSVCSFLTRGGERRFTTQQVEECHFRIKAHA